MKKTIEKIVSNTAAQALPAIYREPLIGYAEAANPIFAYLKTVVDENHLLPADLLPGAKTVLAFFLPYKKEVVDSNRSGNIASRMWAEAYEQTNKLIDVICHRLNQTLSEEGIASAWLLPTYEFDKQKLVAHWSHRHAAYACGLGTFGRNNLLITKKGCAGRLGTMVLDIELEPNKTPKTVQSCYGDNGCMYCVQNCPVEALNPQNFDRHKCYSHCQSADNLFADLNSVEVCGKCSTGPCSFK